MRLIDADELMKKVKKWLPPDPCGREEKEFPFEIDICVSMLMEIEEAPTEIELVRCKDCRYHVETDVCCHPDGLLCAEDDNFCNYGDREE